MSRITIHNVGVIYHHGVFWLIYLVYFYSVNLLGNNEMSFLIALLSVPYFAVIFYSVSWILRHFFRRRNFVVSIILMITFYSLSSCLIYFVMYGNQFTGLLYGAYVVSDYPFSLREFLQTILIMHGHFTMLAILYNEYERRISEVKEKLKQVEQRIAAQQQKAKFEYISLAQQVSAHTMVNVFQYWKSHFQIISPELLPQIDRLYELMLYYMHSHDVSSPKSILCSVELSIVQAYVEIQRSLTSVPIEIVWNIIGNLDSNAIPPTTLMTLIENALKHGITDDPEYPVNVVFSVKIDEINIRIENKIKKNINSPSHGVGLTALRKRLEYIYNDDFKLSVNNSQSWFRVELRIVV